MTRLLQVWRLPSGSTESSSWALTPPLSPPAARPGWPRPRERPASTPATATGRGRPRWGSQEWLWTLSGPSSYKESCAGIFRIHSGKQGWVNNTDLEGVEGGGILSSSLNSCPHLNCKFNYQRQLLDLYVFCFISSHPCSDNLTWKYFFSNYKHFNDFFFTLFISQILHLRIMSPACCGVNHELY